MENFKYSTQTINKKDIINVKKVLKSEFLTKGPKTIEFENKIKLLVKSKYA
jgi:dTDP-4-amino-4,6-dideoxygalactose transaminase|tara:strand:+ start:28 stop:180 length:153 start_codon:yes stop_codon:yes gene_type:complete